MGLRTILGLKQRPPRKTPRSAIPLPPRALRFGSGPMQTNGEYLAAAVEAVRTLENFCGLARNDTVLDIGCGQGRLLIGIIRRLGAVRRYVGLDVHEPSLVWMRQNLQPIAPWAELHRLDYRNERYNPKGSRDIPPSLHGTFDRIVLYSVFSHMRLTDIAVYSRFIRDRLADQGRVLLTVFVEDGVPDEEENPEGYIMRWGGPLHCVRLNRATFETVLEEAGLRVVHFGYRKTGMLSVYVLGR